MFSRKNTIGFLIPESLTVSQTVSCTKNRGSISHFWGFIMRNRLRWLGHILRIKDGRLPKIFLVNQSFRTKQKQIIPERTERKLGVLGRV